MALYRKGTGLRAEGRSPVSPSPHGRPDGVGVCAVREDTRPLGPRQKPKAELASEAELAPEPQIAGQQHIGTLHHQLLK